MQTAVSYNKCNTEQEYILSCGLEFDKNYYSNYIETKYLNITGDNITVYDANEVNSLECHSLRDICLKATL
jgi:hypothetical protein